MMTKLALLTTALLALGAGCATDDGYAAEIQATPLAGKVGGQTWTFAAGHTSAFLSEGEDDFFASLYPMTFTTCGFSEPSGNHVILSIPKTAGEYEMSLGLNMTFVVGESQNLIGTQGTIRVDSVTATNVKGGIAVKYDDQNEINGTFDVTICPPDDLQ